MRTNRKLQALLAVAASIVVCSGNCLATPTLQLNISSGTYDASTETVVAPKNTPSNIFKLFAYLIEDSRHGDTLSDMYYISMAIGPQLSTPRDLGSFVFSGETVNVSSGMTYGTPPLEGSDASKDPGDLSSHGVFPTYFAEWGFMFNPLNRTQEFNTQDNPGLNPVFRPYADRPMFYQEFDVDVSRLDPNYVVHFDLYSKEELVKNVTVFMDHPAAYVPSSPESCANGSTSYPNCTIATTTTTQYPSTYSAAYTSCKKAKESGPTCVDQKGKPNPKDVIVHPESCSNGSTSYPNCTLTVTASTNNSSAYAPAVAAHCTNGSTSYPYCTTTSVGLMPSGQFDIKSFAPYSHDAEGGYHDVPESNLAQDDDDGRVNVPEANSALLLCAGLVVAGIAKNRQRGSAK